MWDSYIKIINAECVAIVIIMLKKSVVNLIRYRHNHGIIFWLNSYYLNSIKPFEKIVTLKSIKSDVQFNPPLHDDCIMTADELDNIRPFLLHIVLGLLLVELLSKLHLIYPLSCSTVKFDDCIDKFISKIISKKQS